MRASGLGEFCCWLDKVWVLDEEDHQLGEMSKAGRHMDGPQVSASLRSLHFQAGKRAHSLQHSRSFHQCVFALILIGLDNKIIAKCQEMTLNKYNKCCFCLFSIRTAFSLYYRHSFLCRKQDLGILNNLQKLIVLFHLVLLLFVMSLCVFNPTQSSVKGLTLQLW